MESGPQQFIRVGYLFLIPLFPLIGSAINAFFGTRIQRSMGKRFNSYIAIGAMALSFCVAVVAFVQMLAQEHHQRFLLNHLWNMFTAGDVQVNLSFALDPLSMMMVLIITGIGTLIHIYSTGYMADEPAYWRFFCYLNLFVFSMLLLVMGDNIVLMFFGWEGVGLCSYLLIGFWYTDVEKARAGVKAFVTNRFGDFGFVLGAFMLFWALGGAWNNRTDIVPVRESRWALADPSYEAKKFSGLTYEKDETRSPAQPPDRYSQVVEQMEAGEHEINWKPGPFVAVTNTPEGPVRVGPTVVFRELRDQLTIESTGMKERLVAMRIFGETERNEEGEPAGEKPGIPILAVIGVLLFVGATAKSAQIPLYVWLPDAMAGPTPVSALIHAATMVTAGVYMIARLNFVFALSTEAMTAVALTGAITAAFAASIGFAQNDIKKVLAYSTVSQLGFMFIGVGVGAYWAGVYHLLTHAFFKACLFLGSGSVILGCHHEQDMRKMGGLKKFMPLTEKTYLYACIAIAGFPIANGFFSKDEILWQAFISGDNLASPGVGKFIWLIGWLTALGTSFYMWRSYYMTFTGTYRGEAHAHGHDAHGSHDDHGSPAAAHADAQIAHEDAKLHPPAALASAHTAVDVHGPEDVAHGGHDAMAAGTSGHHDHPDHKAEGGHGHGGLPHESPRSMTWVLAALAIGCLLTVALGFWAPLWQPPLERWLHPVLGFGSELVEARQDLHSKHSHALEYGLIAASIGVAFAGWLLARAFYKDNKSTVPAAFVARFPRLHKVVYNKYYVDELYQATVLSWAMYIARAFSTFDSKVVDGAVNAVAVIAKFICNIEGAIDKYLVDGAVNFVAGGVLRIGKTLRRFQTGRIETYLYVAVAGALLVVGINLILR